MSFFNQLIDSLPVCKSLDLLNNSEILKFQEFCKNVEWFGHKTPKSKLGAHFGKKAAAFVIGPLPLRFCVK